MSAKLFLFILLVCDIVRFWEYILMSRAVKYINVRPQDVCKQLTHVSHVEFVLQVHAQTFVVDSNVPHGDY